MYIDESTLEYGHNPCPKCQSEGKDTAGDNLMYYGEGQGYFCFGSCGLVKCSDEYLDETKVITKGERSLITSKDIDNLKNKALTAEQVAEIEAKTVTKTAKPYRGVPSSVWEGLGYRWEVNGSEVTMYVPIYVKENGVKRVVGYKTRTHPKDLGAIGYVGKLGGFLNQSDSVADTLIIVGGEIDLASVVHAMENDKYRKSYNIVSSPTGEKSTSTYIKLNYEWVNSHKKIICAMDMDEDGDIAFEKVKAVIDNSKLYKAQMRYMDANEYLKNGDMANLIADVYWNAQPVKTFGIAGSGDIYNEIVKTVKTESIPLPSFLSDLKPLFKGGFPLQELILLSAPSSVGKSAVVNEIILEWIMKSPHRLLVLSFEDTLGTFGAKIASRVSGHNILAMETPEEKLEVLEKYKPEIDKYLYTDTGEHRFNIVDKIPDDIEDLKETILQSIKLHDSKVLLIDPITSLFSDKTNEQQASFMKFLETIKNRHGITVLMSAHTRKGGTGEKDKGEGASYGEESIRGSSSIVGTSTIVILLSRDKMNPDPIERNTTKISVSKSRTYSITGRDVASIYYSPQHHTLFSYKYAEDNGFFLNTTAEELRDIMDDTKAAKVATDETEDLEIQVYDEF